MSEGGVEGPGTQGVRVSDLADADVLAAARIHRSSFADDPVSLLGTEATRRYYTWLLDRPHDSHGFGAHLGGRLVGSLIGGRFEGGFPGFVRRNPTFVLSRLVLRPRLLIHPSIGGRVAGVVHARVTRSAHGAADPPAAESATARDATDEPAWELLVIAVSPEARGHGVGARLVDAAVQRAAAGGFRRLELSVHPENHRAIRFYEGNGWSKYPPDERWSGRMWLPVPRMTR